MPESSSIETNLNSGNTTTNKELLLSCLGIFSVTNMTSSMTGYVLVWNLDVPTWSISYIFSFFLILSFLILPLSNKNKVKLSQSKYMSSVILFFIGLELLCQLDNALTLCSLQKYSHTFLNLSAIVRSIILSLILYSMVLKTGETLFYGSRDALIGFVFSTGCIS